MRWRNTRNRPYYLGLAAAFAAQALWCARVKSVTVDEPVYLAAGYSHWRTGDYRMELRNPPLARLIASLPFLLLRPNLPLDHPSWNEGKGYAFGLEFLFHNRVPADRMLFWARAMLAALGTGLVILAWAWARAWYGDRAGLVAAALCAFCPNLIAHAGLATTDLAVTVFCAASVFTFARWRESPTGSRAILRAILAGAVFGLAAATKHSALLLIPTFAGWMLWTRQRARLSEWGLFLLAAAVVVTASYQGRWVPAYWAGLGTLAHAVGGGQRSFLLGSFSDAGWRAYYVVAFLVKTPLPVLVLLGWAAVRAVRGRHADPRHSLPLVVAVVWCVAASLSRKQLGLRYLLPVYPLLYVWAAGTLARAGTGGGLRSAGAVMALLAWQVIGTLSVAPHDLAYFNRLAGGPAGGGRVLIDSNLDWGQDLTTLKREVDRAGKVELILSYFGVADPAGYGLRYQALLPVNPAVFESGVREIPSVNSVVNDHRAAREWLAVSVTNLRGSSYDDPRAFAWLWGRAPILRPGYSIAVYDITGDAEAHRHLVELYSRYGLKAETAAEAAALSGMAR